MSKYPKYLAKAKKQKTDEYYTPIETIETELPFYYSQFENKTVYCNADNPLKSNFFRYFVKNFNKLHLKKLICTHYESFRFDDEGNLVLPSKAIITRVDTVNGKLSLKCKENIVSKCKSDGDFRGKECLDLLNESDIVVTNPPFSLTREFFDVLWRSKKDFLILGIQTQVGYKEIIKRIMTGEMRLGVNFPPHTWFQVPFDYEINTQEKTKVDNKGNKYFDLCTVVWLTNLNHGIEREFLPLTKKYDPEHYPGYKNRNNAIEVSFIKNIPKDWDKEMGVPITFINKWNPKQFEITGFKYGDDGKLLTLENGGMPFSRVLIRRRNGTRE